MKNSKSRRRSSRSKMGEGKSFTPPDIELSWRLRKTIRYTVVASVNTWPITREDMLNALYMGTGANSARRILGSVKLNKIVIYGEGAFPTTASTPIISTPDVKWLGTGPQTRKSMSAFAGRPFKMVCLPSKDSFAGVWSQTGVSNEADILVEITANTGNIIDVTIDAVIQYDDPSIASALVTSATATAGIIYYNNLGGSVSTIQPQGGNANYAT